jgi:uncharacterized protein (TIGR03437 family)
MAGRTVSTVVAARYFQHGLNSVISVLLAATSPGVFIAAVNGVSPDGILNYGTPPLLNSPANGGGIWNNTPQYGPGNPHIDGLDGSIALTALMFQQGQASLTIGGQPAVIEYAGAAPYQIWGIPQINAVVPAGLAPGPQPVVLTIGQNSTAS